MNNEESQHILEFSNAWNAFLKTQKFKEFDTPIQLAEYFYKLGRNRVYSVSSEIEVELQETKYGRKTRLDATLPSEIEVEKAYYKVFFKEREKFTNAENFSWISGAKAATKVFFQILRGEAK